MRSSRLAATALVGSTALASAAIGLAAPRTPHLAAHRVTAAIDGLPRRCSVTAWEYFTLPPGGHQPWRFTMHYGGGTSCAGGGGLKFLTVEVDRKIGKGRWLIVDHPVTTRIAQPTSHNPLRITASWTATASTPRDTSTRHVVYRVVAAATVSFAEHPTIPPETQPGVTAARAVMTPATRG